MLVEQNTINLQFAPCPDTSRTARLGGLACLPQEIAWPKNPAGMPLILVASLPCPEINRLLGSSLPHDLAISVFSTYSKSDYFLDVITYHGDSEEFANISNGYTKVLIHRPATTFRNEAALSIPAVEFLPKPPSPIDETNLHGSRLGGAPGFLQNEDLKCGQFLLQIYGGDFPGEFSDVFYLPDAVGYLFLSPNLENASSGMFFAQTT